MKIRNGFVSNSSSSSFICDTKLTNEEIKIELKKLFSFCREFFKEDLYIQESLSLPFDEIVGEIGKVKKNYLKDWQDYHGDIIKANIGKAYIESASDNSIPSVLCDLIERKFDAVRLHLG
jgi:hypothetical protein